MKEHEGKTILIVGASSGIGEETARVLYSRGARVILVARRKERLADICSSFEDDRGAIYSYDVSELAGIEGLIRKIVSENGKLDGMVYAAGIADDVPLKFLSNERLMDTFQVNYFGFVEFTRQISRKNCYNKGMRIVAVSSIAAIRGEKAHTAYSASKAAIDATVRCLSKELFDKGISINSVQPAMINTQMYEAYLEMFEEEKVAEKELVKRQYGGIGKTQDVANAISFLLSDQSRFITGISLPIDGGYSTS